jgi:hypothetical protein
MNINSAKELKIDDAVVAVEDGLSDGILYRTGQRGRVAFKEYPGSPFFGVRLDTGEITGRVFIENWERLTLAGADLANLVPNSEGDSENPQGGSA